MPSTACTKQEVGEFLIEAIIEDQDVKIYETPAIFEWFADICDDPQGLADFLLFDTPCWTDDMLVSAMMRNGVFWDSYQAIFDHVEQYVLQTGNWERSVGRLNYLGELARKAVSHG